MKLSVASFLLLTASAGAFAPACRQATRSMALSGYLDNISEGNKKIVEDDNDDDDPESYSREATKLAADKVNNFGVGDWSGFVDFNEFDGGDGQVSVSSCCGTCHDCNGFDGTHLVCVCRNYLFV
jgi:hypothetical protein